MPSHRIALSLCLFTAIPASLLAEPGKPKGQTDLRASGVKLSVAAAPGGIPATQTAAGLVTVGIEGKGASTSSIFIPPDPVVVETYGSYDSPEGGKLTLDFGAPIRPSSGERSGSLLAFWRFDEEKGAETANLKAPDAPATIVGSGAKKARPAGVGFGEVRAVPFDGKTRVETGFDLTLTGDATISIWFKTRAGGGLMARPTDNGSPASGSRAIYIDKTGKARALIGSNNSLELISKTAVNDDKWHHLAWTTRAGQHLLFIDGKQEDRAKSPTSGGTLPQPETLTLGTGFEIPREDDKSETVPAFKGLIDNVRIYSFVLEHRQLDGIWQVGAKRAPIIITSQPQRFLRVGETFNYAIEYTGAPFAQFTFKGMPEWMKFEGRLTGTPTEKDIGVSSEIIITGLCPWGPAQQQFHINVRPPVVGDGWQLLIDDKPSPFTRTPYGIEAELPKGKGAWGLVKKN